MARHSSSTPDHAESAFKRASRDYRNFATNTVRMLIWSSAWAIAGGAVGLWLSWGHGRGHTLAVTVGTAVGAALAALVLPFLWFWVSTPVIQRNEARRALHESNTQPPFPRIRFASVGGLSFSPNDSYRDILLAPALVTNREDHVVSLSFQMWVSEDDAPVRRELPLLPLHAQPLNIEPRHSEHVDLQFRWLGMLFAHDGPNRYEGGPLASGLTLTLQIQDHDSGASLRFRAGSTYPSPDPVS